MQFSILLLSIALPDEYFLAVLKQRKVPVLEHFFNKPGYFAHFILKIGNFN